MRFRRYLRRKAPVASGPVGQWDHTESWPGGDVSAPGRDTEGVTPMSNKPTRVAR